LRSFDSDPPLDEVDKRHHGCRDYRLDCVQIVIARELIRESSPRDHAPITYPLLILRVQECDPPYWWHYSKPPTESKDVSQTQKAGSADYLPKACKAHACPATA